MSYDLLAFDPAAAPKGRKQFLVWYEKLTGWIEGHDYNDPASTIPALQAWYDDMRKSYRNMNGPGAPTDNELAKPGLENRLADYSFAPHAIYATYTWSEAENVYPLFRALSVKHGVGFYDVSGDDGDGEIYFPGDELRPASKGAWRQIAKEFREMSKK